MLPKRVPWWTKECENAIKSRNKAFRMFIRTHNFQNLIEYKKMQANVRKTIKSVKKVYWVKCCNSVGRETEIAQVWRMIKRMNGVKRECGYPVLIDNNT